MANLPISGLTAGSAVTDTDLFPDVQVVGVGPVKVTGAQLKTYTSLSPTLVTPNIGVATGTSLALNGATLGTNTLAIVGSQSVVSGSFGLSGNISAPAWTTSGIRYKNVAATITDTSSTGTVAAAYTDLFGGNTIAASNATTFTDYFTMYVSAATAGTNVTMTNKWALGLGGNLKLGPDASGTNQVGTNVIIGGSRGTGTGAGGSIIFQVAPAGSTGTAQNALATALTIAPSGTGGALTLIGGTVTASAPMLDLSQTWNNSGVTFTGFKVNVTSTASANYSKTIDFQLGGVTRFGMYNLDYSAFEGGGGLVVCSGTLNSFNREIWLKGSQGIRLGINASLSFCNNADTIGGMPDVYIYRDAANTLALRNGTNAQTFNVYNTYTSGTSYERYSVDWITTANLVIVGPGKGSGGGTQRVQRLAYLEDGGTGTTTPLLGATCPAASATVKSWIKVITSDGSTGYIPCWA